MSLHTTFALRAWPRALGQVTGWCTLPTKGHHLTAESPPLCYSYHSRHPQNAVRHSRRAYAQGEETRAAPVRHSLLPILAHNAQLTSGPLGGTCIFHHTDNLMPPLNSIFLTDKLRLDGAMACDHSFRVKNHFENFTCKKRYLFTSRGHLYLFFFQWLWIRSGSCWMNHGQLGKRLN